MRLILALVFAIFFPATTSAGTAKSIIETAASDYFEVYAKRENFAEFMDFYDEKVAFSDIIYNAQFEGKAQLSEFFDWSRGDFRVIGHELALTIRDQVISGQTVISSGTFHKFIYDGTKYGPWDFIIWQEFNSDGRIVRQDDWINYTPKKLLLGEANPD